MIAATVVPFSTSCLPCPVAHPSLVHVYNFIPDVLTQLSGLGLCGVCG